MADDDSPILKRRPLRRPPVIPASPDSPSQTLAKLAVPATPGPSALQSAAACDGSSGSPALQSAVGCRWSEARRRLQHLQTILLTKTLPPSSSALPTAVASDAVVRAERRAARVSSRLSRRQRKLNDKRIAHQAVEVNADNESMEGSSNSEDDAYVG